MKPIIALHFLLCIAGCTQATELAAPCPDYGKTCQQIPINTWAIED